MRRPLDRQCTAGKASLLPPPTAALQLYKLLTLFFIVAFGSSMDIAAIQVWALNWVQVWRATSQDAWQGGLLNRLLSAAEQPAPHSKLLPPLLGPGGRVARAGLQLGTDEHRWVWEGVEKQKVACCLCLDSSQPLPSPVPAPLLLPPAAVACVMYLPSPTPKQTPPFSHLMCRRVQPGHRRSGRGLHRLVHFFAGAQAGVETYRQGWLHLTSQQLACKR